MDVRRDHLNRRSFLRALAIAFSSVVLGRPFASAAGRAASSSGPALNTLTVGEELACSIKGVSLHAPERTSGYDRVVKGRVHGFRVPSGQRWRVRGLVRSDRNVIVKGTLVMRPGDTLRFVNVDESRFVGGGLDPVASDVGLWVMGRGRLDLQGSRKVGWNRKGNNSTWRDEDEIRVAPTGEGESRGFPRFVRGSQVPRVAGLPFAEVFNLTRTVRIEGTPGHRAHIFIRSERPQILRFVTFRHLGPNKRDRLVTGRWPIHFHHCHDGSRGSIVEGCVVRDAGGHAFVAHMSHGVTFRDCIAYNVRGDAYWWDVDEVTHDTSYEHCLAAAVRPESHDHNPAAWHSLAGFFLGRGKGNVVRDCAAVGVLGGRASSGFRWPPQANGFAGAWIAEGLVAHNNANSGAYLWQNNHPVDHLIEGFVAYRNAQLGILYGAYENRFQFIDSLLADNPIGVDQLAVVRKSETAVRHVRSRMDGGDIGVRIREHQLSPTAPTAYESCTFTGQRDIPVVIDDRGDNPTLVDFARCSVGGRDLGPSDVRIESMHPEGRIRIQRADGIALQLDHTGLVTPIPPFA
jgi:hypothetical protein